MGVRFGVGDSKRSDTNTRVPRGGGEGVALVQGAPVLISLPIPAHGGGRVDRVRCQRVYIQSSLCLLVPSDRSPKRTRPASNSPQHQFPNFLLSLNTSTSVDELRDKRTIILPLHHCIRIFFNRIIISPK